jgi:hypothetical protein|tara:strand:+ start:380 stop:556 length:177 start_codon:yes stop_codon:yes gene_type:complete
MEPCVGVLLAVAVLGKYLQQQIRCGFRLGDLVVMDLVHVHVTDVITIMVLVEDSITPK